MANFRRALAIVGGLLIGLALILLVNQLPFIGAVLFCAPVLWWVGSLIVAFFQDLHDDHAQRKAEELREEPRGCVESEDAVLAKFRKRYGDTLVGVRKIDGMRYPTYDLTFSDSPVPMRWHPLPEDAWFYEPGPDTKAVNKLKSWMQ
jgi:hypothetical protein